MRKVLLASDGSLHSLETARVLGRLLGSMSAARVTVVTVTQMPEDRNMTDVYGNKVALDVPVDVLLRRSAEPVLHATIQALGLPEEQVDTEVQVGDPAEGIIDLAKAEEYDLIVVGSRGLGPVREILLGSVSQKVLHAAPCPVLVVR